MLRPAWEGIFDNRKGLYYSNPKNRIQENTNDRTNDRTNDSTKDNKNYNNINLNIPYYNENVEYLKNNTLNTKDKYENLYNLMDRISFISRYLLKGNDYYKLYISKNANKYFTNDNLNNDDIDNTETTDNTNTTNTTKTTKTTNTNDTNDTNDTTNTSDTNTINSI